MSLNLRTFEEQEYSPIECVLPTAVFIGGGVPAFNEADLPGCGPGDPSPPRCGPRDLPPPLSLAIPLNFPPRHGPGDPPVNRITDTCKNTTLPQLRCGR